MNDTKIQVEHVLSQTFSLSSQTHLRLVEQGYKITVHAKQTLCVTVEEGSNDIQGRKRKKKTKAQFISLMRTDHLISEHVEIGLFFSVVNCNLFLLSFIGINYIKLRK